MNYFYVKIKLKVNDDKSPILTSDERVQLCKEAMNGVPAFAQAVMKIPQVKRCVQALVLKEIDDQCQKLCVKTKGQPSVLRTTKDDNKCLSSSFSWVKILTEMKERAPDILDFLVTIAAPKVKEDGRQVVPICEAYAMLMNIRCRELSLVQKINTIVLGRGGATKKVI